MAGPVIVPGVGVFTTVTFTVCGFATPLLQFLLAVSTACTVYIPGLLNIGLKFAPEPEGGVTPAFGGRTVQLKTLPAAP